MEFRIGNGYDVHRLVENRPLIIGGTTIPYPKGLSGHSDADVLAHAITDAILGAAGLGDIGKMFPDSDSKYKNANSMLLLKTAYQRVRALGYEIGNVDSIIVAQKPKMAEYLPQMKKNLAVALGCGENQINIKATTEEHLGFTGKELGIAAHGVCILKKIV